MAFTICDSVVWLSGSYQQYHLIQCVYAISKKKKTTVVNILCNTQLTTQHLPLADIPLYDQPLEMSGKRDRKKVERFVQETKKEELNTSGTGVPLGDIPYIDAMITVCVSMFYVFS